MYISIVNGSPRKNGATAKVLKEIKFQLECLNDVHIDWYDLSDLDIDLCKGCEVCYSKGECINKNDGFEKVSDKIKRSDGLIIGSPTYGSNVPALLKNFIDRGHFIVEQGLYNKNCMSVVTYEIADGRSVLKILNKFFRVSGGAVKGNILSKVRFNTDPLTESKRKSIAKKSEKFYNSIQSNKGKSLYEYIFNDLILVNTIWKPYFKRYKQQYHGIVEKYSKNGIHENIVKMH